jgi:signal transduction histidine kinase
MFTTQDTTITKKLTRMNMVVSGAALLMACATFVAYDLFTFRETMVRDLSIQARVAGSNSVTALVFNDSHAAENTLSALKAAPDIVSAGIYRLDGQIFAAYRRDSKTQLLPFVSADQRETHLFKGGNVIVTNSIVFQGRPTGMVYIRSDLRALNAQLWRYAIIAAVVLAASLGMALLLSSVFRRSITEPIVHLAEAARVVSRNKDYSVRAIPTGSRDELAALIETFNEMLTQIQARDVALQKAHGELELRVQEVARRAEELARSNAELEQFAYVASHDLQEPLRMVASYTQLLAHRYKGRLDSDADEFIGYAVDGAHRMQLLIVDLLAYCRVGTKGKELCETSSEAALQQALLNLRVAIQESSGVVTNDPLPTLIADGAQLIQLFQNVVGNAIKYRSAELPRVHVSAKKNGGKEWIFSIRDNGLGIDPKYFKKIFVMFQRLHGRGEFSGTGIGLTVCKKIAERHGGRMWVKSEPGKGSTFYFALPERG